MTKVGVNVIKICFEPAGIFRCMLLQNRVWVRGQGRCANRRVPEESGRAAGFGCAKYGRRAAGRKGRDAATFDGVLGKQPK